MALLLVLVLAVTAQAAVNRERRSAIIGRCSNNGMDNSARQAFLNAHNQLRSSVARGMERDGAGGYAPKAAKMLKMVYDCDVENSAMRHAQKCVFRHSSKGERSGYGENLFMTSPPHHNNVKAADQASKAWWSELQKYGVGQDNRLTSSVFNRGVGHYTQMAWEQSYKLGCAVKHCPSMTYVVCQYGPAGNMLNQYIYTKGEPCSGCPGKCDGQGLCIV